MKKICISLFTLLTLIYPITGSAVQEGVTFIDGGPIHEAVATKVTGAIILDAVPKAPPPRRLP